MSGDYVMAAIPPWMSERRERCEVVEWRGDRVLLRSLEMAAKGCEYLIETDLGSFLPDRDERGCE